MRVTWTEAWKPRWACTSEVICTDMSMPGARTMPSASASGWSGACSRMPSASPSSMPLTSTPPSGRAVATTICSWKASSLVARTVEALAMLWASASSHVWCMPRLLLAMRNMSKAPITSPRPRWT